MLNNIPPIPTQPKRIAKSDRTNRLLIFYADHRKMINTAHLLSIHTNVISLLPDNNIRLQGRRVFQFFS